jgi:hypothetical protein
MPHLAHILLRIFAGLAGAFLLYVAFFLYEDEEARIQNRLEQVWQWIDALHRSAMSKESAFIQGATRATSIIFDSLFGRNLLSSQSLVVSWAFSLASFSAYWVIALRHINGSWVGIALASLFVMAFLPLRRRHAVPREVKRPALLRALVLIVPFCAIASSVLTMDNSDLFAAYYFIVIVGGFIDILFIVYFRWTLRKIAEVTHFWWIIFYISAAGVVAALLIGPLLYEPHSHVAYVANLLCATNLIDLACLLLMVVVMITLAIHRLLWPLIKRPIYAANRKQLIKNSKLLGALGAMLLLYAFPNIPLVKWLTGFLPNLKGS